MSQKRTNRAARGPGKLASDPSESQQLLRRCNQCWGSCAAAGAGRKPVRPIQEVRAGHARPPVGVAVRRA